METVLSICVVTMNRALQLKEAIESCLNCNLPKATEFIIIDNASTDNTEEIVNEIAFNDIYIHYEKLSKNVGCGNGRNYAYSKAKGKFVYILDDDAVIKEGQVNFFNDAIEFFNNDKRIITLTTQIYDTAWQKNRVGLCRKKYNDSLFLLQMFYGGSHFIRKDFFKVPPYMANEYGFEEILPSLRVIDEKKVNVFAPNLFIVHKPKINKWNYTDEKNQELLIQGIGMPYAIKKMIYPKIFLPILKLALIVRQKKFLKKITNGKRRVKETIIRTQKNNPINDKIKFLTVVKMFFDFGLAVF